MIVIDKLLKKAKKGNDKAFLKLFQKYEKDIYRVAYVYVKNSNDALDVVQETAYKAFKNIHTLQEEKYTKSWLIKISIRNSIDLIRKNKNIVPLYRDSTDIPQKEDVDLTLSLSLQDLLHKLNETEKTIILFKYYGGYSFKEIAELENLPLGTVKSILYRALEKCRKQVRREDLYE
ncbi:RNA polymerase sigma factor [Radiobacillus kanasensis]|nr:sigma-70 family RNA polymerase sigma factor [Radiobacillus kanasensis]UFT98965.1 RNA polymerase sigma factor [Radiobacillus kanasensis]